MTRILLKFISYFIISCLIYFLFLIIETTGLYFSEFGFDLINTTKVTLTQIATIINFGILISFILTTAVLLKENVLISKILLFGFGTSLIFGGIIFFLSDNVIPDLRMTSFLNRFENAKKETFTPQEKADRIKEFKKTNAEMMSITLINKYSDSLNKKNISQRKTIADLFLKIPDSVIQNDFSKEELLEYRMSKNNLTNEFNRRDLFTLQNEIRQNQVLTRQLKKSIWKKNERYLNSFLTLFLVCFGVVIGANFKNQLKFSLVCIGIVIYSQTIIILTPMEEYFTSEKNLIGLIFKLIIILAVFSYLIYRMWNKRNTGANNV